MKLRLLYLLQLLDSQLAAFNKRRRELAAPTEVQQAHAAQCQALEEAQKTLRHTQQVLRDKQLALKTLEEKIASNQKKLMGGKVNNPRELQSLEEFITHLNKEREGLDEEILLLMDQETADTQAVAVAEGRLKTLDRDVADEKEVIDRELAQMLELEGRVKDRREEVLCGVDEEQLALYQSLGKRKGGLAVVAVRGGACGGCGMTLPDMELDAVMQDEEIINCSNCERVLVWDQENLAGRLMEL